MTTTTTFQGMDPGSKNSSRVLRPPGGASNISFGTDEEKPPARKNRTASNIFAEPDDPHAHRRNNPPGGKPTGVLCGEPSAPLRRCHHSSNQNNSVAEEPTPATAVGAADSNLDGEVEPANAGCEEEPEEVPEQKEEPPQPSEPTVPAGAPSGRRNPPGGKSSLILG